MGLPICTGTHPFDFRDACVRENWSAVVPAALVVLYCISSIPIPTVFQKYLDQLSYKEYLPLEEAESHCTDVKDSEVVAGLGETTESRNSRSRWRDALLCGVAFAETSAWLAISIRQMTRQPEISALESSAWTIMIAVTWLYAAFRPIFWPVIIAPYDLFWLYSLHLVGGLVLLFGMLYDYYVSSIALPPVSVIVALAFHLDVVLLVLTVVLRMPLAVPGPTIKSEDIGAIISPEDYTSLWSWLTFRWVRPVIVKGTSKVLEQSDIWKLSPTMRSSIFVPKFLNLKAKTLLGRIVKANFADSLKQFFFCMSSICFHYTGPLFLKLILDSIDEPNPTQESQARAYVFAGLAFFASLLKAECDLHQFYFGRRAATRMRNEVMCTIYDKALKRRDLSGTINSTEEASKDSQDSQKDVKATDKKNSGSASDKKDKAKQDGNKEADAQSGADLGKITNLMSADANQLAEIAPGLYSLYEAPVDLIICIFFLYKLLGVSAFIGVACSLCSMPLNSYASKTGVRIRKELSAARDKRMSIVTELINAIRLVKFFAWEDRWIKKTMDARNVEIKWIDRSRYNNMLLSMVWYSAPVIVSVATFASYVSLGNELTVGTAFTALALFDMLTQPLGAIPFWVIQLMQARVALTRIGGFLNEDEVSEQISSLKQQPGDAGESAEGLGIENGSFKWNTGKAEKSSQSENGKKASSDDTETATITDNQSPDAIAEENHFELRDISVMFPEGQLTVVTGPTASGKTALLMALLGEMTALPGGKLIISKDFSKVDENGYTHTISYAAQSPWLRHQTIKENILFDHPFDEERYKAVLECCALEPDLAVLDDGDATEIGAGGVNLSGGQKARVALARAIYSRTKYVLLDDPLSAVDSHTARFLFDRLFCGPLLANRTVILVTHHVELVLPGTHYLIRMLDGRIEKQGTLQELRAQGVLEEIKHDAAADIKEQESTSDVAAGGDPTTDQPADKKPAAKFVEDEHRETGAVKWIIYQTYLKASSYWAWGGLGLLLVIKEVVFVGQKLWIRVWAEAYGEESLLASHFYRPSRSFLVDEATLAPSFTSTYFQSVLNYPARSYANMPNAIEHPMYYVVIYAATGLSTVIIAMCVDFLQFEAAIRASRNLFSGMLAKVTGATMRWHDTTPQGRIMNRFGKDITVIDTSLAMQLSLVNMAVAMFLTSVFTVLIFFPIFLIPAFFIAFVYIYLAHGYLNTGRDLRRMEANLRSPIFSGFTELLQGIVTVRAFSAEKRFLDNFIFKMDQATEVWYIYWQTNRWLLLNFDIIGGVAVFITTLVALSSLAGSGLAGICITSAMSFSNAIYYGCRFWSAVEVNLNSVERVVEYMDVPQEAAAIIESNRPPAYWPSSSNRDALIRVEDLVVKYAADLPPVLHGLSFNLKARERVGILGRTGSGKSTLAMSLLRFVDPASGRIVFDGIDISTIGLHDLRSRVTFIPQEAILFSGSLRDNLDPFGDHDDSECLDALYRVHMISSPSASQSTSRHTSRAPSIHEGDEAEAEDASTTSRTVVVDGETKKAITLDTQVSAGGTNFSQGQRQLVALARALLRRSSIVILDEATSSIDFATDAKIQAAIREQFNDSLLLTVAHRLQTIIDYDRLLVLDKGQIAEFDTPLNLINKEDGIFRGMCLKSGMFSELEASAKANAPRPAYQLAS